MTTPANILDQDQLMDLMGYGSVGYVERRLKEQGIRPIYGKPGRFFVTLDMLNHAGGIRPETPTSSDEVL